MTETDSKTTGITGTDKFSKKDRKMPHASYNTK